MQPAQAFAPNATTFLTHLVGGGLADKRYVVQRFKSMLDGDIRPVEAEAPKGTRVHSPRTGRPRRNAGTPPMRCTSGAISLRHRRNDTADGRRRYADRSPERSRHRSGPMVPCNRGRPRLRAGSVMRAPDRRASSTPSDGWLRNRLGAVHYGPRPSAKPVKPATTRRSRANPMSRCARK